MLSYFWWYLWFARVYPFWRMTWKRNKYLFNERMYVGVGCQERLVVSSLMILKSLNVYITIYKPNSCPSEKDVRHMIGSERNILDVREITSTMLWCAGVTLKGKRKVPNNFIQSISYGNKLKVILTLVRPRYEKLDHNYRNFSQLSQLR